MKTEPETRFMKLRCSKCKNEQITFSKAAMRVTCHVCQEVLAESTGGKTRVHTKIFETLD